MISFERALVKRETDIESCIISFVIFLEKVPALDRFNVSANQEKN